MPIRPRWALTVLVAYLVAALLLVLLPIGFSEIGTAVTGWLRQALGISGFGAGWVEFFANIALFVPIGLCLTYLFRRPWQGFVVSVVLSAAVELVQIVIPSRVPSVRDLLANTAGAAIGAGIAWWAISRSRRSAPPSATRRAR